MTITKNYARPQLGKIQRNSRISDQVQSLNSNNNEVYASTVQQSMGFWDDSNGDYDPVGSGFTDVGLIDMLGDDRNLGFIELHAYGADCEVRVFSDVSTATTLTLGGTIGWYKVQVPLTSVGPFLGAFFYETRTVAGTPSLKGAFVCGVHASTAQLP